MQKLFLLLTACVLGFGGFSQYWQQRVDYRIDVQLNAVDKALDAFEKITYTNHSPDTLHFIWFHLWPNAYKNDRTAFSDQLLQNDNTSFYFSTQEKKGYINRLDFKVDGITAKTEDHPEHIDIIKLILPKALAPQQSIVITTPFHEKLPYNFSRGGYSDESFQITQWYPKPAVYDRKGWHAMPYLDQGEFFSEFGSFDVQITVPANYKIAATGVAQNEDTETEMIPRKKTGINNTKKNLPSSGKQRPKPSSVETVSYKTLRYRQDSVHDFAWFADKDFTVDRDTCLLPSGKIVRVYCYYTSLQPELWKNAVVYAKDAIRFYSRQVGEYPYATVSVVQGPKSFGGGMEYPTITVLSPVSSLTELDQTIAHEIGHNWFYGVLATNEREHPWMDEGINSFYENKYLTEKYGPQKREEELFFQTKAERKTDQPIETSSEKFTSMNYELVAYHKTAEWMRSIENILGAEAFRKMMQQYFLQWQFRHPYPEDLEALMEQSDVPLSSIALLHSRGVLPSNQLTGFSFLSPLKIKSIGHFLVHPSKNILFLSPIIGINSYDRFMVGVVVTNVKIPPNRFQYLLAPLYGTGSGKLNGLGKLNYSIASDGVIRKTDIFLNASSFSMNEFQDTAGNKLIMQFHKLVPGFRFTFHEKDPQSTLRSYVQWKTFLIREQSLNIVSDTSFSGTDTSVFLHYYRPWQGRYLNQLLFHYENFRALYPFHLELNIEQSKDFIRPTFEANYFFNYREGGLNLRFFAGKFIYLKEKTINLRFDNDRYFLNMTGPKGYEDYTYSDYFAGRNEFEGLASQQIMIRDGGFKVRTDLLADKIGKTDNWLTAINLNTSVPSGINPLSVLPVKLPLYLFLDIGTYAEAWDRKSNNDRFLFDAGFQISLFSNVLNIYFPVLYNKVYSDYFKSVIPNNRFFKTMSFSIQLYGPKIKKVNEDLEF
ncbi:MAG: M1 family metallopeptidase [Flavisolibacter sp.]